MRRLTHTLGTIAIAASLSMPATVFAASGLGSSTLPQPTNLPREANFLNLLTSVINFILALVGTIAVLMLVWGGFQYLTSAGNQETTKKAKQTIVYAIIGIVIIALSYAIVNFVTGTLSSF